MQAKYKISFIGFVSEKKRNDEKKGKLLNIDHFSMLVQQFNPLDLHLVTKTYNSCKYFELISMKKRNKMKYEPMQKLPTFVVDFAYIQLNPL